MEFNAAVLQQVGQPLAIERVKLDELRPHDVLVRIQASGLCHTDLEVMQGSLARPLPIILGHEGAGIVEAVGSEVSRVKPGDFIICSWNPSCGHCFYCERGQPILCEQVTQHTRGLLTDGGTRLSLNGEPVYHFSMVSSHAEYCVLPEAGAVPVPPIPADRACLIGCGVMTGFGAASLIAPVEMGDSVLVIGCGAVGLNSVQAAHTRHAGQIIAVDLNPANLARARSFGATATFNPQQDQVLDAVRDLTAGRGADKVFEAAGNEAAMSLALEAARPGAQIVFLGKTQVNKAVAFRFGALMGEKSIIRSSYGGARPYRDFPRLAQAYLDGQLKLDELITRRIRLHEINEGFADMARGESVRTIIEFDA